jgi:benzoate membrane transport protein
MSLFRDVSLSAVVAGFVTVLVGFTSSAVIVFAVFPRELVLAIAGLALLGTIGSGLVTALAQERQREPALITFLVTASGVSFLGVGSAFWGLVAGVLALVVLRARTMTLPPTSRR